MLSNKDIYNVVNKVRLKKWPINLKNYWQNGKKSNYISESTYKLVCCIDGVLPRVCDVPKVHKLNSV